MIGVNNKCRMFVDNHVAIEFRKSDFVLGYKV